MRNVMVVTVMHHQQTVCVANRLSLRTGDGYNHSGEHITFQGWRRGGGGSYLGDDQDHF